MNDPKYVFGKGYAQSKEIQASAIMLKTCIEVYAVPSDTTKSTLIQVYNYQNENPNCDRKIILYNTGGMGNDSHFQLLIENDKLQAIQTKCASTGASKGGAYIGGGISLTQDIEKIISAYNTIFQNYDTTLKQFFGKDASGPTQKKEIESCLLYTSDAADE